MTDQPEIKLEDPTTIEETVGAKRDRTLHIGRVVTETEQVYILHSQECKDSDDDLRICKFSTAMGATIQSLNYVDSTFEDAWGEKYMDKPVVLGMFNGYLVPVGIFAEHHKEEGS